MVRDLTTRAGLPMPKLYVIPQEQPNAFATGRNPNHSAVAVTAGIRKLLTEDELRGVLAHELGHVRNHDILLTSVASAIGSAITWIAYMLLWFGGDNDSPLGAIGRASRWSCSRRSRPGSSRWRSRASASSRRTPRARRSAATPSRSPRRCCASSPAPRRSRCRSTRPTEPLYIVKPFKGGGIASLFSTHPPIEERVRRLRQMRPDHRLARCHIGF